MVIRPLLSNASRLWNNTLAIIHSFIWHCFHVGATIAVVQSEHVLAFYGLRQWRAGLIPSPENAAVPTRPLHALLVSGSQKKNKHGRQSNAKHKSQK